MISFIRRILPGRIVLTGVMDEGSNNLVADAIKALKTIGNFNFN